MSKPSEFPTEFRGCMFDDEWEFDAPCVIYFPRKYRSFGIGGNTGYLDRMLEDICIDIAGGEQATDAGLARECEWRSWSIDGFKRRKKAWHVRFSGHWRKGVDGYDEFVIDKREEQFGPFAQVESKK